MITLFLKKIKLINKIQKYKIIVAKKEAKSKPTKNHSYILKSIQFWLKAIFFLIFYVRFLS